ncbi:hypothetical protein PEXP_029690 [Penicillium expansum]|nr:hypothetical protein PEXP_029690 [Penicillium expansum]
MTRDVLDVAIVGAGFSGILALHRLRQLGLRVRGFERKASLGGVWRENAYPGAAVDSPFPFYQFYDAGLLQDWQWREEYPSRAEMLRYFEQVDREWSISEGFEFGAHITGARFSAESQQWAISLADGREIYAQWFIPAVGFNSVVNMPQIPGLDRFQGQVYHTAQWPHDSVSMENKNVAVIGTGPSGVQIIQSVGEVAKSLTIYQQTPFLTLPKYGNRPPKLAGSDLLEMGVEAFDAAFQRGLQSFSGFDYTMRDQDTLSASTTERLEFYQKRIREGGWAFWMGGFRDLNYDARANRDTYDFWAENVRPRLQDAMKRDLLVPHQPGSPFGVKRPCLEDRLYEMIDRHHVDMIDVSQRPIQAITIGGIQAHDEIRSFDVIIMATGFGDDASGLKQLSIHGRDGVSLAEMWSDDIHSFLGMAVHNFPNMLYLYGPQCPSLLVSSPAVIHVQVEWICQALMCFRKAGVVQVESTAESQKLWREKIDRLWSKSLYCRPGAKNKGATWIGGLVEYQKELCKCLDEGFPGFDLTFAQN